MPEITPELIARLRELDKKASPAPWKFTGTKFTPPDYIEPGDLLGSEGLVLVPEIESVCPPEYVELIVEARNALPALLDDRDRLEAENKKLREQLETSKEQN